MARFGFGFATSQSLPLRNQSWKEENQISKKAMLAIVELIECLVGGSRFLNEAEAIKVEDASIEIKDILNELYETL
mgnify:CR=1 FL=1